MTRFIKSLLLAGLVASLTLSCNDVDDPGPKQADERKFSVFGFDRLDVGDAFQISVEQGDFFEVIASGDRRNLDDLKIKKEGTTLVIGYDDKQGRKHTTSITIRMPQLLSASFSGATDSRISGFLNMDEFNLSILGASICQLSIVVNEVNIFASGASNISMLGEAETLKAELSGASVLQAYGFPVITSNIRVSGASDAKVTVSDKLDVYASGGSTVAYRGNPLVTSNVSGGSSLRKD